MTKDHGFWLGDAIEILKSCGMQQHVDAVTAARAALHDAEDGHVIKAAVSDE